MFSANYNSIRNLFKEAKCAYWEFNSSKKIFSFSDSAANKMALPKAEFSLEELVSCVEDVGSYNIPFLEDISISDYTLSQYTFSFGLNFGYRRWVSFTEAYVEEDEEEGINLIGSLLYLNECEVPSVMKSLRRMEKGDVENIWLLYDKMPICYLRLSLNRNSEREGRYSIMDINKSAKCIFAKMQQGGLFSDTIFEDIKREEENIVYTFLSEACPEKIINTQKVYAGKYEMYGRFYEVVTYSPTDEQLVCLFLDITEEETTLWDLQRAKDLLDNIYNHIPVGVELYDKNGRLYKINKKDQELFGIEDPKSVYGLSLFDNPNIPKSAMDQIKKRKGSTSFSMVYDFTKLGGYYETRHEGKRIVVIASVLPLFDNNGTLTDYMTVCMDNAQEQIHVDKILSFEQMFSVIGKYSKVGYAQYDIVKQKGYATSSWFQNMNEKTEDLSFVLKNYSTIDPDDRAELLSFIAKAEPASTLVKTVKIKTSEESAINWITLSMAVGTGSYTQDTLNLFCVNYNVTSLKEKEELLKEFKIAAEKANENKNSFLANMSHAVRTPLNAIMGFADLLAGAEAEAEDENASYVKVIKENSKVLQNLSDDIILLSRIESGLMVPHFMEENLESICREVVDSLWFKSPKDVQLVVSKNLPSNGNITIDKKWILRILFKLVENAYKFTLKGQVEIGFEDREHEFCIYVKDTGVGVAKSMEKYIFERFYTVDFVNPGAGLGLPICKKLIERMQGQIVLDSKPGIGTTVWVTLPKDIKEKFAHE